MALYNNPQERIIVLPDISMGKEQVRQETYIHTCVFHTAHFTVPLYPQTTVTK
jgi:hypothetical protein